MKPVTWLTTGANESAAPETLWQDIARCGWLPTQPGRVVIHAPGMDDDPRVRDTVRSLATFLHRLAPPPRIEIVDGTAASGTADPFADWPGVERLDLRRHPRYLVDVACLRDGAWIPEAWLDDLFVITVAGVAPDGRLGIRGVLAAQAALLDAPHALDLDVAFEAHRLLRPSLGVACGAITHGDARSGSWWAISPDDIALERAVASQAGLHPDALPVLRHFARHELLEPPGTLGDPGAPRIHGYTVPAWRVGLARLGETTADRSRRMVKDLELSAHNIRRLPQFLQRRMPSLARFGRTG